MYLLPLPFIRSVLVTITVIAAAGRISGITINESLIEASLLINLTSSNNNDQVAKRRFSNVYSDIDVNLSTEIDSEVADANQSQNDAIENSFKIILTPAKTLSGELVDEGTSSITNIFVDLSPSAQAISCCIIATCSGVGSCALATHSKKKCNSNKCFI